MRLVMHNYWLWTLTVLVALSLTQANDSDNFSTRFSKASCNFTLNFFKHVVDNYQNSNIIFSPASVSILLAVLQQGAKENTAVQLEKVLGVSAEESRKGFNGLTLLRDEKNVTLDWGNRCYLKPELILNKEFHSLVKKNLDVDVQELNFGVPSAKDSANLINSWISKITHGHIQDLVQPSMVTPSTIMMLVNAIYFKGPWLSPFKKGKSTVGKFDVEPGNKVDVTFMSQREKFYADRDRTMGAKWVQLPFQNRRFSMFFILPTKKHRLNELVHKLTGEDLHEIFTAKYISQVKLRLPKFKLSEKVSLVDTLKGIGITDIFSSTSNLSGISDSIGHLEVSEIIHQANVEIDEQGSTGSAATVIQLLRMGTPNLSFVANQPFLFFIVDLNTNIPLFAGKVVNPQM